MTIEYTLSMLRREFVTASKHIRRANKGLPWPVKICQDYKIFVDDGNLTMQISYTDGNLQQLVYNIAL